MTGACETLSKHIVEFQTAWLSVQKQGCVYSAILSVSAQTICMPEVRKGKFEATRGDYVLCLWSPPAASQGPELLTRLSNIRPCVPTATPLFPGQRDPPPGAFKESKGGWVALGGSCLEKKGVSGETEHSLFSKRLHGCHLATVGCRYSKMLLFMPVCVP